MAVTLYFHKGDVNLQSLWSSLLLSTPLPPPPPPQCSSFVVGSVVNTSRG